MAAIAHQQQIVDEPLDPDAGARAYGWFTAEAHDVLARAHAVCGHPPARELPVEVSLDQRAERALSEARTILQDLAAETDTAPTVFPPENFEMADEYDGSTFGAACRKADAKARTQPVSIEIKRTRQLLEDDTSLERAYSAINRRKGRVANSTIEALVFSLRDGVKVLEERDVRRRLSELTDDQFIEVGGRLRRLKPEIAVAWTAADVGALLQLREKLR
jgi:hypothetical protein